MNAPSDRQSPPFLAGFRQAGRHVQVIQAVIAGIRAQAAVPVWLVGTIRGTQSAAFIATELAGPEGPRRPGPDIQHPDRQQVDRRAFPEGQARPGAE